VLRGGLADLDVQDRRRPNLLEPRILPEHLHRQNGRFLQAFGLNFSPVPDLPVVNETDGANPQRYGEKQ
jgi:hypothetical protein